MARSLTREWIAAHRDYPHKDWCLIWPFARDPREGRAIMNFGNDRLAHRVMCREVHGPNPIDKPQVSHLCGNGHLGCVNPNHLVWASNSENQLQRYAHGRGNSKSNGNKTSFTPEQIADIRAKYGEFTQEKLAEMYGVSIPTIQYYLKYRETRGHAGLKVQHWTPEQDDQLRAGIAQGLNFTQLAATVGKSASATSGRVYRLGLKSGQPPAQPRTAFQ